MDKDDFMYFYFPNKSKLAVNALLEGMEDPSVYVNRGVLDFMATHLPIVSDFNTDDENKALV
jgi:hypothetical protein